MAVNYKNIILDLQGLLYENIGSIISGADASYIDWNDGIDFNYSAKDQFLSMRTTFGDASQAYLTGNDAGVEINGFVDVNIFNQISAGGNNVKGLETAKNINEVFGKYSATDKATLTLNVGDIILNDKDEINDNLWVTVIRFDFIAIAD